MKHLQQSPKAGKKKWRLRKWVKIVLIIIALVSAVAWGIVTPAFSDWMDFFSVSTKTPLIFQKDTDNEISLGEIKSHYAVLTDYSSGKILAEVNGKEKLYPASLTKIMTIILSLEIIDDITDVTTVPEEIFTFLYEENASMAGFQPGERVTYEDLLYGAMLPSGGECCLALCCDLAGSEDAFVELMNQKAEDLGMVSTHFANSTGLHEKDHYSTAEDIMLLLRYSLQNSTFRKIFTSKSYLSSQTEEHPHGITMYSTMWKDLETENFENGKILGGKTGYTPQAGLCLASLAKIKEKEYLLVTAKAPGDHETEPYHIMDAQTIYKNLSSMK